MLWKIELHFYFLSIVHLTQKLKTLKSPDFLYKTFSWVLNVEFILCKIYLQKVSFFNNEINKTKSTTVPPHLWVPSTSMFKRNFRKSLSTHTITQQILVNIWMAHEKKFLKIIRKIYDKLLFIIRKLVCSEVIPNNPITCEEKENWKEETWTFLFFAFSHEFRYRPCCHLNLLSPWHPTSRREDGSSTW